MAFPALRATAAALSAATLALGGCTYVGPTGPPAPRPAADTPYQRATSRASLEIPPDLSRAGIRDAYPVPAARAAGRAVDTVLPEVPDMRIEREGELHRLVVAAAPADLWQSLHDFWRAQGFDLAVDNPEIGVMETGWAGKRVDLPVGGIRRLFERFKRAAYTYEVRDRYRTRIERSAEADSVSVYIAHRGAHEVARGDSYAWEPRPSEPGLEAEMLARLMHFLGGSEPSGEVTAATTAGAAGPMRADWAAVSADGTSIRIDEGFDRAWRRVGLALDRGGFTVVDLDRSGGLFLVRYIDPEAAVPKQRSWLRRLAFWSRAEAEDAVPENVEYRIVVERGEGLPTRIVVRDDAGGRDTSASAGRILGVLAEHL